MLKKVTTSFICCSILLGGFFAPVPSSAQQDIGNLVDLDLTSVISCTVPDETVRPVICNVVLPYFLDQLVEGERVLDAMFAGYRNDMPAFMRNQVVDDPIVLRVQIGMTDGDALAVAQVDQFVSLLPNPLLRRRGGFRAWALARTGIITFNQDFVVQLVLTDATQDVLVHEAFHAIGHPFLFDVSGLNASINDFNQVNFAGDLAGINGVGYGISEFREESGNPFASFVPLAQSDVPESPTPGHLSEFEPAFVRFNEGFQEIFIPTAAPPGIQGTVSRAIRGMFADLGYLVRGVNAPGIIDLDGDGVNDEPLIVNPTFDFDNDPTDGE